MRDMQTSGPRDRVIRCTEPLGCIVHVWRCTPWVSRASQLDTGGGACDLVGCFTRRSEGRFGTVAFSKGREAGMLRCASFRVTDFRHGRWIGWRRPRPVCARVVRCSCDGRIIGRCHGITNIGNGRVCLFFGRATFCCTAMAYLSYLMLNLLLCKTCVRSPRTYYRTMS
jgi:hypothetical protein